MKLARTMKLSEYLKEVPVMLEKAAGDVTQISEIEAQVLDAKAQAEGKGEDPSVTVVVDSETPATKVDPMMAKLDAMMKVIEAIASKLEKPGYGYPPPEKGDEKNKQDPASIGTDLAIAGLDKLVERYSTLKTKVEGGTLSVEDLKTWDEGTWDIKRAVEMGASLVAKADSLKAIEPIVEELKKLDTTPADPPAQKPVDKKDMHQWPYDLATGKPKK